MSTRTSIGNAFDEEVATAAAQLQLDQTAVNEALVHKIFQCERAEAALRTSEDKLHALLAHQLGSSEEERRRVALEIHDTLGQNLLALRLDVAALHQQTTSRQTRLRSWTGAALDNLDGTINTIKQLIIDLRPFQLELGLQAALEWECNKFRRRSGIACTVTGMEALHDVAIDEVQLLTVYRVLQECLSNVERHANANAVAVTLGVVRKKLTMRVADNGVGVDPAYLPTPAFGLMGMRERVGDAGGTLALVPAAPHGTVVTVTLPMYKQK
jgi:signal transduction histidine kinase